MGRILVVEDYPGMQNLYVAALQKEGYEVDACIDGREALELAKEHEYKLILLDMLLTQVNGLDFLRGFDKSKKHPGTKILAFSNIENENIIAEAKELGVDEYYLKASYTPNQMLEIVKRLLDQEKTDKPSE
jgi:DNA-binding response OmpR family regulator